MRVAAGLLVGAVLGCAAAVIRNGNRLTALEVHVPYIRDTLDRIEKKVDRVLFVRYAEEEKE